MSIDQAMDKRRRRLLFRCWHRGTKEVDILLGGFADAHVETMDDSELDKLEQLLEQNDIDLYNCLLYTSDAADE